MGELDDLLGHKRHAYQREAPTLAGLLKAEAAAFAGRETELPSEAGEELLRRAARMLRDHRVAPDYNELADAIEVLERSLRLSRLEARDAVRPLQEPSEAEKP